MERMITAFHSDEVGDWVAELSCGHNQHVRHRPPFHDRPWVVDQTGRESRIGAPIECPLCERTEIPGVPSPLAQPHPAPNQTGVEEGGDPACWLHQVCEECGTVLEGAPHRHDRR